MSSKQGLFAVVIAALVGNTTISIYLILERAIFDHVPLLRCLLELYQWDASNGLGPVAFSGGWSMAFVGLLMDLVVSTSWAALFLLFYRSFAWLRNHVWAWGLIYGVIVMFVMLWLIVPLGHASQLVKTPAHILNVLVAHTVFFGTPVAVTVARNIRVASPAFR